MFKQYSDLVLAKRNVGRPRLRYIDVCKRDWKSLNVDIDEWENLTDNSNEWRWEQNFQETEEGMKESEYF